MASKESHIRHRIRKIPWFLLCFVVYSTAIFHYFFQLAEDRYVSRTKFVVTRGSDAGGPSGTGIESMLGGGPAQQDAYTAINYITSIDMLRFLQGLGFELREHYSKPEHDLFFRLAQDASEQDLYDYFQGRIDAHFDEVEGIIELKVQAFDPEFAQLLAHSLITRTASYLNETNRAIAEERMRFVLEELATAEEKLEAVRTNLIKFQNENLVIDPQEETKARLELIQELKKQKVLLRARIIDLRQRSPQSPVIADLQSEVDALDQEIERESETLTGEGPEQMNQLIAEFSKLNQDLTFATQRYEQSLSVAEEVRIQTVQAHRFLSVIEKPFRPEEASEPRRLYLSLSMVLIGFLGIQMISLLVRTVLEHRN